MHPRRLFASALILLAVACGTASAQDPGKTGLAMGYPPQIAVIWHATRSVAIRPEFSFDHLSSSSNGAFSSPGISTSATGVGVSALFYTASKDALRMYVAPRYVYAHTTESGSLAPTNSHSIYGLFGAQYAVGTRFSVFGETGFGYTRRTSTLTSTIGDVHNENTQVGLRTGAGVILYF